MLGGEDVVEEDVEERTVVFGFASVFTASLRFGQFVCNPFVF